MGGCDEGVMLSLQWLASVVDGYGVECFVLWWDAELRTMDHMRGS